MRPFAVLLLALALAGCGGESEADKRLVVSAASSLKQALPAYEPGAAYSFAGSDELAAQIRQGIEPDVFLAANTTLPEQLHDEGLAGKPVVFATNRLVVAVPAEDARVRTIAGLAEPGVKIAVGAPTVPVGAYAKEAIAKLPGAAAIERNIRTREPDVAGVVGKILQGAVDAGFVYATDVRATGGELLEIEVPTAPPARYGAVVVRDSERAREFVAGLATARALRDAGFGAP